MATNSTITRVNAVWLDQLSTDPRFLVNREREVADLLAILAEFKQAGRKSGQILVTGERGVGKSIFSRTALARFAASDANVIAVEVAGRGLSYRRLLDEIARRLVAAVIAKAEKVGKPGVTHAMEQLRLLVGNSEITGAQTEGVTRQYGAGGEIGSDLFLKAKSSFTWQQATASATTSTRKLLVTDEVLADAIQAALEIIADKTPWRVVLLFDDLDQTTGSDSEAEVADRFRRVCEFEPCISLVHFRTEAMVENVRREVGEMVELQGLSGATLVEIVRRRLQDQTEEVTRQFRSEDGWAEAEKLATATSNPLVYLRWLHGLLRTAGWPPVGGWATSDGLASIVRQTAQTPGADIRLIRRAVAAFDAAASQALTEAELRAGGLSAEDITDLKKLELILPKQRFKVGGSYVLQPVLTLLAAQVQRKLAQ